MVAQSNNSKFNKRFLKAFVRYDGSGKIVPGSLVLAKTMPKVGIWREVNAYTCCTETTQNIQ